MPKPAAIPAAAPVLVRSAQWIADSAQLPTAGLQGFASTRGIAALLAETIGIWLADGEDLSKTMAHVDRRLRLVESWVGTLTRTKDEKPPSD